MSDFYCSGHKYVHVIICRLAHNYILYILYIIYIYIYYLCSRRALCFAADVGDYHLTIGTAELTARTRKYGYNWYTARVSLDG